MSWLLTAVNKAVEVGNRKNITRTVRNYADSVVQQAGQAVAEGAKLLQDRIGVGAFKSVNQTIQRLEEAAVSYRGHERALLITRWLSVLKEIDRATESSVKDKQLTSEEQPASDEAKRREWVLFVLPFFCIKGKEEVCKEVDDSPGSLNIKYYLSKDDCDP